MDLLKVQQVSKSFGPVCAVNEVSFSLKQGENMAIVGESGCGKTTLAKMIMGLIKPDQGSIVTDPYSLQIVFQDPYTSLDPLWNVRQILTESFWRQRHLILTAQELKMKQMLRAVGLSSDILTRFPHEFSGGERQRIAIARALLASPKILLLDEAVSALDTLVQKQIIDLLKQLKQDFNLSYIFISHNLRLVKNFSDKIAVMYQGKIIEQGPSSIILQSPQQLYTQQLFQAGFYTQL